nr:hypothetical protein SYMBAF_50188 [Serratia symbiotica]
MSISPLFRWPNSVCHYKPLLAGFILAQGLYVSFLPWAVLTILTYSMYAAVIARSRCVNWLQQSTLTGIGSKLTHSSAIKQNH